MQLGIDLALQGGGAHGAFTWGVLDRLLEDERIEIDAVSGASAGAMNAVVLADGLMAGGRSQAREALRRFWSRVSNAATAGSPLVALFRDWPGFVRCASGKPDYCNSQGRYNRCHRSPTCDSHLHSPASCFAVAASVQDPERGAHVMPLSLRIAGQNVNSNSFIRLRNPAGWMFRGRNHPKLVEATGRRRGKLLQTRGF